MAPTHECSRPARPPARPPGCLWLSGVSVIQIKTIDIERRYSKLESWYKEMVSLGLINPKLVSFPPKYYSMADANPLHQGLTSQLVRRRLTELDAFLGRMFQGQCERSLPPPFQHSLHYLYHVRPPPPHSHAPSLSSPKPILFPDRELHMAACVPQVSHPYGTRAASLNFSS